MTASASMPARERISLEWLSKIDPILRQSLEDLSGDDLLAGPKGNPSRVVISPFMAKPLQELLVDTCIDLGIARPTRIVPNLFEASPFQAWIDQLRTAPVLARLGDIAIVAVEDRDGLEQGYAALGGTPRGETEILGVLSGPHLSVDPAWSGLGIGSSLVATCFLLRGELPTWDHDKPGYSPAGVRAVHRGFDLARDVLEQTPELEANDQMMVGF